ATFAARALDSDRAGLTEVLRAAAEHRGTSFVEILQDCPIFNDGSFDDLRKENAAAHLVPLRHGEPIRFGADGEMAVVRNGFGLRVARADSVAEADIVVHDAYTDSPEYAYALSRLSDQDLSHVVTGVFRSVSRPTYDDGVRAQAETARERKPVDDDALQGLLTGRETWTVG
ncbi:2-oxoacid:ferredoxin oxidoreductase subunit beta, partial [Nocardia otitidiscaviarum]|nr:2-oxoacid:ferredoxin oxidoreductase subunit beta [Nocardia otitidiscaviarum]